MWAPADLFNPFTNSLSLPLRRGITYFAEHPMVLLAAVILIGVMITVVELTRR